jgi:hypothetical protein
MRNMLCKITNFLEDYRTEIIVFGLIGITFGGLILAIKQQENDYVAKNVWIIEDGDLRPMRVDIKELVFKVKLKEDT